MKPKMEIAKKSNQIQQNKHYEHTRKLVVKHIKTLQKGFKHKSTS